MIQAVLIFLVIMLALGFGGRIKQLWNAASPRARRCPACGRPRLGKGPCPCGADKG